MDIIRDTHLIDSYLGEKNLWRRQKVQRDTNETRLGTSEKAPY